MSQYKLTIITDFSSAHSLRNYPGDCKRVHGHNWKVEVEVESLVLNDLGMVIDFKEIKKQTKKTCKTLDHYYLNDLDYFNQINPTAENIAKYLFTELTKQLNTNIIQVSSVTLWETDSAKITYSE